jgi:Phage tail assembly chaperone proteins, E, or 41 or 14
MSEKKSHEPKGVLPAEEKPNDQFLEVILSTPLNSFGEEITVLKMRRPNGIDLINLGQPCDLDPFSEPPRFIPNIAKSVVWAARLSGIPSPEFGKLSSNDLMTIGWKLVPFFAPNMGT